MKKILLWMVSLSLIIITSNLYAKVTSNTGKTSLYNTNKVGLYFSNERSYVNEKDNPFHENAKHVDLVKYAFWRVESDGHIVDPRADLDVEGVSRWPGYALNVDQVIAKLSTAKEEAFLKRACQAKKDSDMTSFVLSIGGWGYSDKFSQAFSTSIGRQTFINDSKKILSDLKCEAEGEVSAPLFSGIDIDWEYPIRRIDFETGKTQSLEDAKNLQLLVIALRKELGLKPLISLAIPHTNHPKDNVGTYSSDGGRIDSYFTDGLGNLLKTNPDFIDAVTSFNLMSYDFMAFAPKITTNAPFKATDAGGTSSAIDGIKILTELHIPKNKIFLGIPMYGRAVAGDSKGGKCVDNGNLGTMLPKITDVYGAQGSCVIAWPDYKNILIKGNLSEATYYNDDIAQYGFYWNEVNGSTKIVAHSTTFTTEKADWPGKTLDTASNGYLSFDTPDTVYKKVQYAKDNGLYGVFLWEASQDVPYNSPNITINGQSYPLSITKVVVDNLKNLNKRPQIKRFMKH